MMTEEDNGEVRHGIEQRLELNEVENNILEKILEEFEKDIMDQPSNLQSIDRGRTQSAMEKVDRMLQHVILILRHCSRARTGKECLKRCGKHGSWASWGKKEDWRYKEPCWKRQKQGKIKKARGDLGRLETIKERKLRNP